MIVHKLLVGAQAGRYLPFALARLQALDKIDPKGWFTEKFKIGGYQIEIRHTPEQHFIRIIASDSLYFEFATSGYPVVKDTIDQLGNTIETYKGCVVGVEYSGGAPRAQIREQMRSVDGAELSLVKRPFQVQLISEPAVTPNVTTRRRGKWSYPDTLYESFAPVHAHTGVHLRDTAGIYSTFQFNASPGPMINQYLRDALYDVPYMRGANEDPVTIAYIRDTADWPRANGVQLVTDETYGSREFAIYVDAFNVFNIFPTAAIDVPGVAYSQNVPEDHLSRVTPTIPAWCYVPAVKARTYVAGDSNLRHWDVDQPELDWKFNHLGTKAMTIAYEREPYAFDTAFWAADQNPDQIFTSTKFDGLAHWLGYDSQIQNSGPDSYNPDRYFVAPGIIEAAVVITLTGPNLEDFTAAVNVTTRRQPSTETTTACPALVGYVWHDMPGGGQKTDSTPALAKAGDPVVVEFEEWTQASVGVGYNPARTTIMSVKNLDTTEELFSAADVTILGADVSTLSFALRVEHFDHVTRHAEYRTFPSLSPNGLEDISYAIKNFGVWIVHSAVGKEVLFPSTMPEDAQGELTALTTTTGREQLAARILIAATEAQPEWTMLPLTTDRDLWADSALNTYREWWAWQQWHDYQYVFAAIDPDVYFYGTSYPDERYVQYKDGGSPPSRPGDADDIEDWLGSIGGDFVNLMFCDAPRWGWTTYSRVLVLRMQINALSTFYVHPNGSYMFWDDSHIYNAQGMPGTYGRNPVSGTVDGIILGYEWQNNTLDVFDETQLEHVLFDRVCLKTTTKQLRTTFKDLYNQAVQAGLDAETLESGIDLMPATQAVITAEVANNGTADFLDLRIDWDGVTHWLGEQGVLGDPAEDFPPLVGKGGNTLNPNMYQYWKTTNYAGAGVLEWPGFPAPARTDWHVRFANPLVLAP